MKNNFNIKLIIREEVDKFLNEIGIDDIEVIKNGWGNNSDTTLKIGDEYQRGRILNRDEIPDKIYHVTVFKNEVLSDGYLKPQRMGKGFGGGRIEGISATPSIDVAEQYYWGMLFAIKIANAGNVSEVDSISDWWFSRMEKATGEDLSNIKNRFNDAFHRRYEGGFDSDFVESAEQARRESLAGSVNSKIKDPIIIDSGRLKGMNVNNMAIFIINKNEIPLNVPMITGTDISRFNNEISEIRILGRVDVNNYYTPQI